jgi:hypothetical protein
MAALSRPSLRSSSRHNVCVDDSAVQPSSNLPTVRPGKRQRDTASVNHNPQLFKKHKSNVSAFPRRKPIAHPVQEKHVVTLSAGVGITPLTHVDPLPHSDLVQPSLEDSIGNRASRPPSEKRHDRGVEGAGWSATVDKRSLRSHDGGSRLKSELASYFANYDELLSTEAKQPGRLPLLGPRFQLD